MTTGAARYPRTDRLLRSSDFQRVSRHGERAAGRHLVLLWTPHKNSTAQGPVVESVRDARCKRRLGVTVSRKVGNAVTRNRVKRAVREWFRHEGGGRLDGLDFVVIARRPARELSTPELWTELDLLAPRAEASL